jgi:hypothetical protein
MQYWKGFLVASCVALVVTATSLASQDGRVEGAGDEKRQEVEKEPKRPATAKDLFACFAKVKGLQASFTEKKYLALLAVPLEIKGSLYFLPTQHLTRVIDSPTKSSLRITPNELLIKSPDAEEVIDLRLNPDVRAFVSSLVYIFAGDSGSLEKSYSISYELDEKEETRWSLTLIPLKKPLTEMIQSLRMDGAGGVAHRITIHEPNGDRAVTTITKANVKRIFTNQEKLALFGIKMKPTSQPASEGEKAK